MIFLGIIILLNTILNYKNYDDVLLCCRGGKQIDFLGLNDNYNFELQEIVSLGNIKTIKQVGHNMNHNTTISIVFFFFFSQDTVIIVFVKLWFQGDEIAVECTYNTSSRTSDTKVGA